MRAIRAQDGASDRLFALPGVVGTGATVDDRGRACILVLLARGKVGDVPATVGGVRVETEVLGEVHPWSLTSLTRPLAIGISAGSNQECLPGTLGCVLVKGNRKFALSANHVFARENQGMVGEAVVQPSRPDGNADCSPEGADAVIGTLDDFEPVVYDGKTPNVMDAAIAMLTLPASQIGCGTPPEYYGYPSATVAPADMGQAVMKLGRTTGLTRGTIKAVNVKTKITFPAGVAYYTGQFLTSPGFGDFGDSGSLVVTQDGTNRPVGMVIGGTNNGSAIASPIGPILARFAATICSH
jgi:hypothetical protein